MVCDKPILEIDESDHKNGIYLCMSNCKKYHKIDADKELIHAMFYLDVNRVEHLLHNMSLTEIANYRIRKWTILDNFINHLGWSSGPLNVITLASISSCSFRNTFWKNEKIEKIKCAQYKKIVHLICAKAPQLITEIMFVVASKSMNYDISRILHQYYEGENKSQCMICTSSQSHELITNVCKCKSISIHIHCLIDMINMCGLKCKTCLSDFKVHIDNRRRMFFPFSNIYPEPLMSYYHIIPEDDLVSSLKSASFFLIEKRVQEILNRLTKEEYIQFRNTYINVSKEAKYHIDFKLSHDNFLMMTPYPRTNMSCDKYPKEHERINELFKCKDIELGIV
jgi:hypothetical protein